MARKSSKTHVSTITSNQRVNKQILQILHERISVLNLPKQTKWRQFTSLASHREWRATYLVQDISFRRGGGVLF